MSVTDEIKSAHQWFRGWIFESALPFWAGPGHDGPGRGARESLTLAGLPSGVGFKRMRVQARQTYAFAHAGLLGWPGGEALSRDGYAFMTRHGQRAEGGWVRRLSPDGDTVLDDAADLYDQSFVLFALAWYARLAAELDPLLAARSTIEWIRASMAAPHGGFHNVIPVEAGPRQQNPHMHLLEAVLALYETTREDYYASFAHELVHLFRAHLFDAATGTLGEFFAPDWTPSPGPQGSHIEPGHHYEWVWLLDQYERLTGGNASAEIDRLYRFAVDYGTDPRSGLVWDVVDRSGAVRQLSTRLWPQTEALKAHSVMLRRGASSGRLIPLVVDNLRRVFFANCPEGAWIDQFDANGAPLADKIPTSSFYHVFMGYGELDRLVAGLG